MSGKRTAAMLASGLALLAAPAVAPAATYCVHQPADSCAAGEIDQGSDLQAALDAALQQLDSDLVRIGPGTYSGEYAYSGPGPVEIVGAGAATVLTAPPGDDRKVLDFSVALTPPTVRSLDIVVPGGNAAAYNIGIYSGGLVESVNIRMPDPALGPVEGAIIKEGGTFRGGTVTGDLDNPVVDTGGISTVNGPGPEPAVVEDSSVIVDEALAAFGDAVFRRLDLTGRSGIVFQAEDTTGSSVVEDVLWRTPPGAGAGFGLTVACGNADDADVLARNLTLVNATAAGRTVSAVCNVAGRSATLELRSSIVLGGESSLRANANDGPATIDASYSDFDPATVIEFGPAGADVTQGPGNLFTDPLFVGLDDFRLATGSLLIDAGDPAALGTGESATDLSGAPRVFGGRRDIGAYEWSPDPVTPALPSNEFTFGKLKRNKRKGTAKLEIEVPGPGLVELAKTAKLKRASATAEAAGSVTLRLRPRGTAKRRLGMGDDGKASARVKANVTFTPLGGIPGADSKRVKLVRT